MTLSDLERPSGRRFALFHTKRRLSESTASTLLKLDPYCHRRKCSPENLVFGNIWYIWDGGAISAIAELLIGFIDILLQFVLS